MKRVLAENFLDSEKALACIHCGLCLGACPTYLETGNENDSPRGRIYIMRALAAGRLPLGSAPVRHLDLCLGCRACETACPSGVQYGTLLESTREHIERKYRRGLFDRLLRQVAIAKVFPFPRRFRLALWPARWLQRIAWLFPSAWRDPLMLLPRSATAVSLPEFSPAEGERRGTVGMIEGCVMSVLFGATNAATVRLLNQSGYDVVVPKAQICCGALYAHGGDLARARQCARTNIAAFGDRPLEAIIINAAGCGSTLKEYGHLLADDPKWKERALQFSRRVKDLTEWLASKNGFLAHARNLSGKVTFHDACHLAHPQHITREPRQLLRKIAGANFVELPEADVCCGSAGSYNLTEPEMAARLQHRKVQNILQTGAEIVVTTNPGCILQIQAGLQKAGAGHIKVVHLAELLERQLRGISDF